MVLPSGAALVRSFVFNVLRLSDPDDLDEAVHAVQPGQPPAFPGRHCT